MAGVIGYGPPYGSGTSSAAPSTTGGLLHDPTFDRSWGSRKIDPAKKDYVVDATTGRTLGMCDVQQLVLLALCTEKGSSAVRALGQELRTIDRASANFQIRAQTTLQAAVAHLVDAGLIEVLGIVVESPAPGRGQARLVWRDLTVDLADPNSIQETVV